MILTTGKIVFVTDPDESDCYIENLRMEYNTNLYRMKAYTPYPHCQFVIFMNIIILLKVR